VANDVIEKLKLALPGANVLVPIGTCWAEIPSALRVNISNFNISMLNDNGKKLARKGVSERWVAFAGLPQSHP